MIRIILQLILLLPVYASAQLGLKAGFNFANITKVDDLNTSSRTGFHAGVFIAPASKKIISSKTEFIFSRQGYNFKTGTQEGSVMLDYIVLPQLMGIRITKYAQLQVGGQIAYLLNAKSDSSSTNNNLPQQLTNYFNRFDYGLAGGAEFYPFKGLLIGGRINFSLGELFKPSEPGDVPTYIPNIKVRNNLVQIYVGWRFDRAS